LLVSPPKHTDMT